MISGGSLRSNAWVLTAPKVRRGQRLTYSRTGRSFRLSMVLLGADEVLEAGGVSVRETWSCAARWNDVLDAGVDGRSALEIDGIEYAMNGAPRNVSNRDQRAEFELTRMIR